MIGNERKTDRKTLRTFVLLCDLFLCDGWIRDTGIRGSAGAGGGAVNGGGGDGGIDLDGDESVEFWSYAINGGGPYTINNYEFGKRLKEEKGRERESE
ncbi:hypothetical protein G4B88_023369 [Cannabis sativa]|uniref:Uncharacterized protein n=1 Tax=Cannabis sativa TaxID=3483 RepID=A0A7J6HZJ1_CANSA|nr:hypothetical protein G4B88_023369 [Cannabis sativa]